MKSGKLNNKGFAFSTMLYGCLGLILVILGILLAVLKSNSDQTFYYSETLRLNLDKCINEEVALEKCYASGTTNCDSSEYRKCLGLESTGGNTEVVGKDIRSTIQGSKVASGDGLYIDNSTQLLYYKGMNVKNYIKYSDSIWRIISVDNNGIAKLAGVNYLTDNFVSWDSSSGTDWVNSSLQKRLNNEFLNGLNNKGIIASKTWYTGKIYTTTSDSSSLSDLIKAEESSNFRNGLVGLPSASDYYRASLTASCNNVTVKTSTSCESWLSGYPSWVINAVPQVESSGTGMAYYFDGSKLSKFGSSNSYYALPVIYVSMGGKIVSGDGTSSNPFILE